jgi:hypothetical protein
MKPHYILAAAAAASTVLAMAAAPAPLPPSWHMTGDNRDKFTAGVATSPEERGAKFLRSATNDPDEWAGLSMSVDTRDGKTLAFYNTSDKPAKGTSGWQERSIVLDVPADATLINFGAIGAGTQPACHRCS